MITQTHFQMVFLFPWSLFWTYSTYDRANIPSLSCHVNGQYKQSAALQQSFPNIFCSLVTLQKKFPKNSLCSHKCTNKLTVMTTRLSIFFFSLMIRRSRASSSPKVHLTNKLENKCHDYPTSAKKRPKKKSCCLHYKQRSGAHF